VSSSVRWPPGKQYCIQAREVPSSSSVLLQVVPLSSVRQPPFEYCQQPREPQVKYCQRPQEVPLFSSIHLPLLSSVQLQVVPSSSVHWPPVKQYCKQPQEVPRVVPSLQFQSICWLRQGVPLHSAVVKRMLAPSLGVHWPRQECCCQLSWRSGATDKSSKNGRRANFMRGAG
jgi:hypothetical protein